MKKFFELLTTRNLAVVLIVLPMLVGGVYLSFFAADRYVSRTVLSVRDISGVPASQSTSSLSSLLGGGSSPAYSDLMYLRSYIQSMDMLKRLDARLKLREHYTSPSLDVVFRLPASASDEDFLAYFIARLEVAHDDIAGLLMFNVQAFDKDVARKIGLAMLEESERFMNEYMHRIAREKMDFASSEVKRSLEALQKAKGDVLAFQTRNKLLDPLSQATANSGLVASLQATLAQRESDLKAAQAYMAEDSYQVKSLRGQVAALQSQLETERLRSTSAASGGAQLASLTIQYQGLLTAAAFAEDSYKSAVVSLEQARLDLMRKIKAVVTVEPPTQPQLAYYPRRLYSLFTMLAGFTMLFAVVRLIVATIREHQD